MILKNYGEALQQQLQEQAELQLQLQQHLEQEIYPWLAWVSKKNIIRIKKKSLGSKKNIRIKKYSPWFNSSVFKFAVIFRGNLSKSHGDFMKVMDVEQRLQRSFWDGMSYGIS